MRRFLLCIVTAIFLVLVGCELFLEQNPLGSIHHVSVGLNYYGTNVKRLNGTLNDADELQACLEDLGAETKREYHGHLMTQRGTETSYDYDEANENFPTKDNILNKLTFLQSVLGENDLTIFSYSGHGDYDGSLVLAPTEISLDGTGIILDIHEKVTDECSLGVEELLSKMESLPGKKLLILDSCYCGAFVEDSSGSISLIEKNRCMQRAFETYFSSSSSTYDLFVLAATTSDNTSKEPVGDGHIHGYFSRALLEGLGWNQDTNTLKKYTHPAFTSGILSLDSLYAYIHTHQILATEGIYAPRYQHPTITGGALDLVIFRN